MQKSIVYTKLVSINDFLNQHRAEKDKIYNYFLDASGPSKAEFKLKYDAIKNLQQKEQLIVERKWIQTFLGKLPFADAFSIQVAAYISLLKTLYLPLTYTNYYENDLLVSTAWTLDIDFKPLQIALIKSGVLELIKSAVKEKQRLESKKDRFEKYLNKPVPNYLEMDDEVLSAFIDFEKDKPDEDAKSNSNVFKNNRYGMVGISVSAPLSTANAAAAAVNGTVYSIFGKPIVPLKSKKGGGCTCSFLFL